MFVYLSIQGVAFSSSPAVVLFEDFEVYSVYRKKVVLTNISYTINFCRLQGISASLADMVSIKFDPPGSMSAGMMCHMLVTFHPQVCHACYRSTCAFTFKLYVIILFI